MAEIDGLLAMLDLQETGARKAGQRMDTMRAVWVLLFAIFFAAAVESGVVALRYGWETGQWGTEYQTKLLAFILLPVQGLMPWAVVILWPLIFPTMRQFAARGGALRDSAAQGAGEIPVASDVAGAIEGIAIPSFPAEFGPFRRLNGSLRTNDLCFGLIVLACGVVVAGTIATLIVIVPTSSTWPRGWLSGGVAIGLALCAAGIALLLEARRLGRRVRVQADDLGLRWEQVFPRRREVHVAWGAIRAIFVISHLRRLDRHLACVVDGGDAVLAFDLSSASPSAEVASANQLAKLVLARTGLPLLDQTKLAEQLCARRYTPQYRAAYDKLAQLDAAGHVGAARLPHPLSTPRFARLIVLFLLPLVLIPICVLSGIGLQHYQAQTYGALLAEARTHTPLYHDALARPDADWPARGPISGDPNSYAFAGGGYRITPGPGSQQQGSPFVEVYAPGIYHDAVVEVTMRMASGGVPYGSAGLALHAAARDAGGNLHLGINGDGSWGALDLAHCPPQATGPDDSTCSYDSLDQASAVHHGVGAPNTLTAILRGNQVICFINGTYVGSIVDRGPQSGRLGLGVEGLGVPVTFSDFTIYPL